MSEFIALPVELIVAVLNALDGVQFLLRCRQICRFLQNVVDNAVDLQYKIHLVVACMDDGPPSDLGSAKCLAILKDHQQAWNKLDWTEESSVSIFHGNAWELLGGVLCLSKGDPGRSLVFRRLPSRFRGIKDMEWTIEDMGFIVEDFTIDTSQDLLVAIEISRESPVTSLRLHLRSLTTGDPHPLATSALPFVPTFRSNDWQYNIQINANRVGVHFQPLEGEGESELSIWNWTTGELELWLFGIQLTGGFSFLTHSLIVVCYDGLGPQLRVYDVDQMSGQVAPASSAPCLCLFGCPAFSPRAFRHGVKFFLQAEPVSPWSSHISPNVPFYPSQNNKLLVLTCVSDWPGGVCVVLLVPLSTLLNHINRKNDAAQREISWAEWGPSGTRMMTLPPSDVWVCHMHGMKFVVLNLRGELEMYDFNPLSLKRSCQLEMEMEDEDLSGLVTIIEEAEDSESDGHFSVEYLTGPEVSDHRVFRQTITTSLPCQRTTTSLPRSAEEPIAVMMTHDSLVIVEGVSSKAFRILTF